MQCQVIKSVNERERGSCMMETAKKGRLHLIT